jgi:signal transduction histidine kinase
MRGASVVRRRSVTNLGDTTGSVNGGQADGGGSGLLAGGNAKGDGSPAVTGTARQDTAQTATSASAQPASTRGGAAASPSASHGAQLPGAPGTVRPGPARARRSAQARSRFALANWRVRWRLAAVIAVPTAIAAVLGGLTIYSDIRGASAAGRVQHLAQLNASVVQLTQALEDERDLSAGYAADRSAGGAILAQLRAKEAATDSAAATVENEALGVTVGDGYQPNTVQDLNALISSLKTLHGIRQASSGTHFPASEVIRAYTNNVIEVANTFSASTGDGANDADLQSNVTTLGALLRVENELSLQRAILYAALNSPSRTLGSQDLLSLNQADQQWVADKADFYASTSQAEQQNFNNTVSGPADDLAATQETLAEQIATATPDRPLTSHSGLTATSWYDNMQSTIGQTRQVADGLVASITSRANALKSRATQGLLINGLLALVLLLLVILVSTTITRSLIRPLRKLRSDALDVAGHRLPEMVRRLSQSEGADEGVDIEPIGVDSTDEIGEVARAFDQVHREAVRLAADEAMLRGNLNAMFINLSRRSQSLIERQLSLIDSLEQSEQDPGRLSSLFRLDHLATRMRRNSENLLVLAGHEVTRRWSQPVPLVDVLRAAISEIEQYERVVLNVQPGIVVVGQAVNDVVHLVAEIVENATTFSPEDTQVYVSGQPLSSGGVLLDITDNGVGISDQEMSHANWRLDNPPVVDVAVSRRMGLFVVGRLAARHGVRVRLRHAQAGGLTALIWLPDTVAAPEVAPPLGRLRRFEADDYGPATSLSAPTQAPAGASQATTAARIPKFSPMSPSSPSFASSAGAGGAGAPGSGTPSSAGGAAGGLAARSGDDQDEPTQALPAGNGSGSNAGPATGTPSGDGAEVANPRTQPSPVVAGPGSPSRLPAFGGPGPQPPQIPQSPIGSQNVHGGDGPNAAGQAVAANGSLGTDGAAADPGKVTIPPAVQDQRLPIFDSLESDWFRRSGKPLSAARSQGAQGAAGTQGAARAEGPQGGQGATAAQPSWTSPADEGWRAAEVVASPAAGETTQAGLPRRVPRANLVPGSVGGGGEAESEAPARSPDAARTRMASFQRGVREGRAASPRTEEP